MVQFYILMQLECNETSDKSVHFTPKLFHAISERKEETFIFLSTS